MKTKNLLVVLAIALVFAFVAVIGFSMIACSNGGDSSDNTSGNNSSAINPQSANVYYEDSSFPVSGIDANVYMYIEGYYNSENDYFEMKIPTPIGKITNGKLSFTLPNVSAYADKGLPIAEEFSEPAGYTKTETGEGWTSTYKVTKNTMEFAGLQDAKTLWGDISFSHEGKEYWLGYRNETTVAFLVYFNKPGTLKGEFNEVYTSTDNGNISTRTYNDTYNCTFSAGWNVIYINYTSSSGSSTYTYNYSNSTNSPANVATMRWMIVGGGSGAPSQN